MAILSLCALFVKTRLVTFQASKYFSIHELRHLFSLPLRLGPGFVMQFWKHTSFTLEISMRAFCILTCSATAPCSFCRVAEPPAEDETVGVERGLLKAPEADVDVGVVLDDVLLLFLSEPLPPKKPPKDMVVDVV